MTTSDPTPTSPPEPKPVGKSRLTLSGIIVPLFFFVAGLALGIIIERSNTPQMETTERVHLSSAQPVTNKLDPRYTDANDDLVADAPKDPAQWQDPDTLVFSFVAHKASENDAQNFKDLRDALAAATGKKVEHRAFEMVGDQIKALREGKIHIAAFNTGGVPAAVDVAGFVPFAALANDAGVTAYEMEVIVPTSSTARTIGDLKGGEIVFTSGDSNSGCKAPRVILDREFGFIADRDYTTRFSGNHEASIIGVSSRIYPAAAIANDVMARMVASGTVEPRSIRSIYKSKPFPRAAFGYPHNLKPEIAEKIRSTFLAFKTKGTSLEKGFQETRFAEIDFRRDWKIVRDIDDASGLSYADQ